MTHTVTYSDVRTMDRRNLPGINLTLPPELALARLLELELAYGGRIMEVTPTKVVTVTTCLGATDTITITGTEEVMADIIATVGEWHKHVISDLGNVVDQCIAEETENGAEVSKGMRVFYLTNMMPIKIGSAMVEVFIGRMLCKFLGIDPDTKHHIEDLRTAAALVQENACSREEAVSLL